MSICTQMFTHLWPHVQGSVFQYSSGSKLPMNTHIPYSYQKCSILCALTPSICEFLNNVFIRIYSIHLHTFSDMNIYIKTQTHEKNACTHRPRCEKSHSDRPRTEQLSIFLYCSSLLSIIEITEYTYFNLLKINPWIFGGRSDIPIFDKSPEFWSRIR